MLLMEEIALIMKQIFCTPFSGKSSETTIIKPMWLKIICHRDVCFFFFCLLSFESDGVVGVGVGKKRTDKGQIDLNNSW